MKSVEIQNSTKEMTCKLTQRSFFYFGFGSNMLAKRIHIQNPTAVRKACGKLLNYRLDFHTSSTFWQGAPATIVPHEGATVYGSIWEIDCCNMKDLDSQEGVHQGLYIPIEVPVLCTKTNTTICCRAYHLADQPVNDLRSLAKDAVPNERQPSKTYLKTLIKGAIETGIEPAYIEWLKTLTHNGKEVAEMEQKLELESVKI